MPCSATHLGRSRACACKGGVAESDSNATHPSTAGSTAQAANTEPIRRSPGRSTSSAPASPNATPPALTVAAAGSRS